MARFPILLVLLFFGVSATASAQATRTWVSGVGDDANPCSRTAPCKTFQGAFSKTAVDGEIDALDPGGMGAVTLSKSMTIDGLGMGSILASSPADGVNIDLDPANAADPVQRVLLRNLSINGAGLTNGSRGIDIRNARTVILQNVTIDNFAQVGIALIPEVGSPAEMTLMLDNVHVADGANLGLQVLAQNPGQKLNVIVRNSTIGNSFGSEGIANSGAGITADSGASVWLIGSTIFGNRIGVKTLNTLGGTAGVVYQDCGTLIAANRSAGDVPIQTCPVTKETVTNNTVTQIPGTTVTVTPPVQCVVPNLKGLTTSFAKTLLRAVNCDLGRQTKKRTKKRKQIGTVLSQATKAGTKLAKGTKVAVTVGKR